MKRTASEALRNLEMRIARLEKQSSFNLGDVLNSLADLAGTPRRDIKRTWVDGRRSSYNKYSFDFVGPVPISYYNNTGETSYGVITITDNMEKSYGYTISVEEPPYGGMKSFSSRGFEFGENDLKEMLSEMTKIYKVQYKRIKEIYGA